MACPYLRAIPAGIEPLHIYLCDCPSPDRRSISPSAAGLRTWCRTESGYPLCPRYKEAVPAVPSGSLTDSA
jgi:hypothetical protein